MTPAKVNKLFYRIFKTQDRTELLGFSLEIEKLFKNNELGTEDSLKLQLALHTKENEMAIYHILDILNTIALSTAEDAGMNIRPNNMDKLH